MFTSFRHRSCLSCLLASLSPIAGCGIFGDLGFDEGGFAGTGTSQSTMVASLPPGTDPVTVDTSGSDFTGGSMSMSMATSPEATGEDSTTTVDPVSTTIDETMTTADASTGPSTGDDTETTGFDGECVGPPLDAKCPVPGSDQEAITVSTMFTVTAMASDQLEIDVSPCVSNDRQVIGLAVELGMDACFWEFDLRILCPSGGEHILVRDDLNMCGPCVELTGTKMTFRTSDPEPCLGCNLDADGIACSVRPADPLDLCEDFLTPCEPSPDPWILSVTTMDHPLTISSVGLTFAFAD